MRVAPAGAAAHIWTNFDRSSSSRSTAGPAAVDGSPYPCSDRDRGSAAEATWEAHRSTSTAVGLTWSQDEMAESAIAEAAWGGGQGAGGGGDAL